MARPFAHAADLEQQIAVVARRFRGKATLIDVFSKAIEQGGIRARREVNPVGRVSGARARSAGRIVDATV